MTILLLRPYATFAQGATVDLDNATEASLVAQGRATYTVNPGPYFEPLTSAEQQALRGASLVSGVVAGLAASSTYSVTAAKSNAALLNAALLAAYNRGGGQVFIPTAGIYYISADNPATADRILSIYSNVTLDSVPGVVLKAPSGSDAVGVPVMVNANYRSNKVSVISITTATSSAPFVTTSTLTATAHGRSVGDFILLKGDTSGYFGGLYGAVFEVQTVPTANTLTFQMFGFSVAPGSATGTVIMYPADSNFEIGPNVTIDCNLNTNTGGFMGGLGGMGCIFNKASNYRIRGTVTRAGRYGSYPVNSHQASFFMGNPQSPSSCIQMGGPLKQIRVSGFFANQGNDVMPILTDDSTSPQYDLRDSDNAVYASCTKNNDGDVSDVLIQDIQVLVGGSRNVVLAGSSGYKIKRVTVRNTQLDSSLSSLYFYISSVPASSIVIEDLLIDGFYGVIGTNALLFVGGGSSTETINFKNITLRNCGTRGASVGGTPTGLASSGLVIFGTAIVAGDGLLLDGIDVDADLTNAPASVALVSMGGGTGVHTIKNTTLNNCTIRGTGATRGLRAIILNANAAPDVIRITNTTVRGNISALIDDGSTQAGTSTFQIANCFADQGSASSGQAGVISSGGRAFNLVVSNTIHASAVNHFVNVSGGSGKTFDIRMSGVKTSNRLMDVSAAHTFNFRSGGGNSSDNFSKSSGSMIAISGGATVNFLDNCADIGVNCITTNITRQDGTIIYNTNAALGTLGVAGLVAGAGTAANSWRLMGDALLRY